MKHLLSFIIFALMGIFSISANAQSYTQMWKDVARAFNDDLPKSALVAVQRIREKAAAENNQPQLLSALCTEHTISHEISSDSDSVTIKRIEDALLVEKRPVERALWQYALAKIKKDHSQLIDALVNVDALGAARAADYIPLFVLGADSRCYNGDLLSVLTDDAITYHLQYDNRRARLLYQNMRDYYEKQGNSLAVLVSDFNYSTKLNIVYYSDDELIARIREAMPAIKKIDRASKGNLAKVMMDWINDKECPTVGANWEGDGNQFHPGEELKYTVSSRNVAHIELRIFRANGVTNTNFVEKIDLAKLTKDKKLTTLVASVGKDLQHTPAHEYFRDTLSLSIAEPGYYIAQLVVNGKEKRNSWLHITNLAPVIFNHQSAQGDHIRMNIVDSRTGQPFVEGVGAQYRAKSPYNDRPNPAEWTVLKPQADGSFDISKLKYSDEIAISVGENVYHPTFTGSDSRYGYYRDGSVTDSSVRIFTDRAIYRPGQKVQVGGMAYSRFDDEYKATEGLHGIVVLQDTNRKDIAEIDVTTDEFGQFSAEFTLPEPTIPGRFAVIFRSQASRATEYINVEEYKRPTFRVKLDETDVQALLGRPQWEMGDTLVLNGCVETFAGVPVPDAEVKWETTFQSWSWLRWHEQESFSEFKDDDFWNLDNDGTPKCGATITTDDEGRFTLRVPLKKEGFYRTSIDATVSNGETASEQHAIYVGRPTDRPLKTDAPEERPQLFSHKTNEAGDEATFTLNLRGMYREVERPVYVFYDIVSSKGGLVSHEVITLRDDEMKLTLKWREEYGDGAVAHVAFVKNNSFYDYKFSVRKPLPDKRLLLEWSTFRDHLQPGQQETWTLSVKRPDGTPADARVMARLYDASLDAFQTRPWSFALNFDRSMPFCNCWKERIYSFAPNYNGYAAHSDKALNFSAWQPSMFRYYVLMTHGNSGKSIRVRGASSMNMAIESSGMLYETVPLAEPMMATAHREVAYDAASAYDTSMEEAAVDNDALAAANSVKVRENFDETAFFMPCLRTDSTGQVTLNFTLPESLTSWNFTALAHDKSMDYGILSDTIFAQKKLTTEIAAPRFLREGDKTDLPVTVRSLCDAALKGELFFVITDAKTGKPLKTEKRAFQLACKNAAQTFTFPITATCDINVRAVAKGSVLAQATAPSADGKPATSTTAETFSDGEERNIPFIDGRETIQVSVPFSSTEQGTIKVDLSRLNLPRLMKQDAKCKPQLSVEYSANPIWNVIRVVPTLLEGQAYSATDWATRLYAIEVGDFLTKKLHNTESGALIDSLLSAKDIPALRYSALDHLKEFQRGDGGFSWFRDFYSSPWITADVCVLLARQQKMTGSRTASAMLNKAVAFMEQCAAEMVKDMKKNKATGISEVMLRYLYVRQLLGIAPDKDAKYLLELAAKEKKDLTMYGKSVAAQILADNHADESLLALQSLVEFTVATEEMGRHFDTERAFSGWASYKIPTQTMAIEALGAIAKDRPSTSFSPEADGTYYSATDIQTAMKLWLLQSKRTQKWESNRASADATYALLHGDCNPDTNSQLFQTLAPEGYSKRELSAEENARAIRSNTFNIIKDTDGLSWGAVYADYTLPIEQVEASSAGFTISRQWEVLRDGKWQPIELTTANAKATAANAQTTPASAKAGNSKNTLKVGERVRQTITIRAERDYDFVQVESSRAACMEPLHPLSGIDWMGGTTCYRMVRDSSNDYYFEHLAKGTHTVTEELIIDRSGTFQTGLARVQCTFAPEFGGYAPSSTVFAICK